jgi:hypothetical protein
VVVDSCPGGRWRGKKRFWCLKGSDLPRTTLQPKAETEKLQLWWGLSGGARRLTQFELLIESSDKSKGARDKSKREGMLHGVVDV